MDKREWTPNRLSLLREVDEDNDRAIMIRTDRHERRVRINGREIDATGRKGKRTLKGWE